MLFLALGLGGLVWWLASSASAKPGDKVVIPDKKTATPTDWQKAIAEAIASGDPETMRKLATALEAVGMRDAASDLRTRASAIEAARNKGKPEGGGPGPISPTNAAAAIASAQSLAGYIASHKKPPGSASDKTRDATVMSWQKQEGLKPDGWYGPLTGSRVAAYRVVPPKPWYWPRAGYSKALKDWKALMVQRANENPDNRTAWLAVSKVP
jgi:hypothetical protein